VSEITKRIEDELQQYPVTYAFGRGGRHPFVVIKKDDTGETRRVVFSGTSNDQGRNWLNIRSNLRQVLREIEAPKLSALGIKLHEASKQEQGALWPPPTLKPQPAPVVPAPVLSVLRPVEPQPQQQGELMPTATAPPPTQKHNGTNGANGHVKTRLKPRPKAQLLHSEVVAVTRHMCTNAAIDNEKRLVTYKDGWSDERILKIIQAQPGRDHLKVTNIIELRRRDFGLLPAEHDAVTRAQASGALNLQAIKKSIDDLVARMAAMESAMEAVKGAVLGPEVRL
jgi:hypothetical protein